MAILTTNSSRARRRVRRREAQRSYETLTIEGGLLAPEWLDKVAALSAPQQSEAEYGVLRGVGLRDEIGTYWRVAQAHWSGLVARRCAGADPRELAERFVPTLLREVFGFQSLAAASPVVIGERMYPIGHAALSGRVPVVVAPVGMGLEASASLFADGARKRSAFGLAQEYLNAAEGALWGVASDGLVLRILRDNASLTRPAWIEADLRRIFEEARYADFAALYLLLHESRFGQAGQPVTECALEAWRGAAREEGTRAREYLRRGVEDAVLALGNGFISHKDNGALRAALSDHSLTDRDYFNQVLRLVYRMIFLLTVEERGLLHPPGTAKETQDLYAEGYGLRRLRERAARRTAYDRHGDLWASTRILFHGVAGGEPLLGLPALAGIFAKTQCAAIDAAQIENRALLTALFRLSWLTDEGGLARVNWRDMGPEELGSVYESLLELVPVVSLDAKSFSFATGGETKGNARKTSGSYYTPDSLVQVLLDNALEPVIKERLAASPDKPVEALLSLSIVDPACGSGHFLLAAARRLAGHVARLKSYGTPSAAEYRSALRQVVGRCIYGVDLNPLAVELCKVALWMEAVEPGLPLGFLDAHIREGNALLGTTPELMKQGIPDDAWAPIEGDDRKVASALKKRNCKERAAEQGLLALWAPATKESVEVARAVAELEAAPDADVAALAAKEGRWAEILASGPFRHQRFVADTWCAAFVWPKPGLRDPVVDAAPTTGLWRGIRDGQLQPPSSTVKTVESLAAQYHFFHWHLAFPTVFERGGFDVVLGNPPWEQIQLDAQEFFAAKAPELATVERRVDREAAIAGLRDSAPHLYTAFLAEKRSVAGSQQLLHCSGRFPLSTQGRINSAPLFVETAASLMEASGRAGLIVPTGIATDTFTRHLFGSLVARGRLLSLLDFENEEFLFPNVHHAMRFCLLTIGGDRGADASVDLMFFARKVSDLSDSHRRFSLSAMDFSLLNPNTGTCPVFRLSRDVALLKTITRQSGVLIDESRGLNPWGFSGRLLFMMDAGDDVFLDSSKLQVEGFKLNGSCWYRDDECAVPLLEGKMIHLFDHRFGTYEGQTESQARQAKLPECSTVQHADPNFSATPRYWVRKHAVHERLGLRWNHDWYIGWRDITNSKNERTTIASVVPASAAGDTLPLALFSDSMVRHVHGFLANLCSMVLDYTARQKVSGMHLRFNTFHQLTVLSPATYIRPAPWTKGSTVGDWLLPLVIELTYTAWDLEPFARDVGYDGPPFRWDPARRILLRAELDAAFFHLYGLSRDDTDYILDTFPVVKKNDEKANGEYRTKRVILEIYDAMAEAARTGVPYQTRLDPPPADPRVAHLPRPTGTSRA